MPDANRGKEILKQLTEYPLDTKKPGVRDYVFFFVPQSDGYGQGARAFFTRFYPSHVRRDVASLEQLISVLHADVNGGVQQIRELVIVAHGNSLGLILPLVDGVGNTNLREFKYLTAPSLAMLQKDIVDKKFQQFEQRRKKVVAHLHNDSWVTIRACNFGNSKAGMYAVYSFFGGRANVYAPTVYQFFGSYPLMDGMRLESRLDVHEHLVRQRFLPKDIHTPERKDAVVRALVDPAQFSEPFSLAAMRVEEPAPEDAELYEGLVDALSRRTISEVLKAKFLEQQFELSPMARVSEVSPNTAWLINDTIKHEDKPFQIEYQLYEAIEFVDPGARRTATLRAEARLVETFSASEFFPIQLFFDNRANDEWRGKEFTLAFFTDDADAAPQPKALFDALRSLLPGQGGAIDVAPRIRSEFDANGITLSPQAKIKLRSASGTGDAEKAVWIVENQPRYVIKLEHLPVDEKITAHVLNVFSDDDKLATLKRQYGLISWLGSNPDTPGTELAAYLDRFTIDELAGLIDHLRSPFKPGQSIYLHHAQQALKRKKEFGAWVQTQLPDLGKLVLTNGSYVELSLGEDEDKDTTVYEFDFNDIWREIKASAPSRTAFQTDLFVEEPLAEALKIPGSDIANRDDRAELVADSPFAEVDELRRLERLGFERLFAAEKNTFELPRQDDTRCADLRAAIDKWKEVQHLQPEAIKEILAGQKAPSGKSLLDVIQTLGDHYSFLQEMGKLVQIIKLPPIPTTIYEASKELTKLAVTRVPFLTRFILLSAVLEVLFVIEIPFKMWMEFAEAQVNLDKKAVITGKLTAIRQWLRALELLTFADNFPDTLEIDIATAGSAEDPYYLFRYRKEQFEEHGRWFNTGFDNEKLQEGFDAGVVAMQKVAEELMSQAQDSIDQMLRQSGLDSCMVQVLKDANVLNLKKLKALTLREFARQLLDQVPRV